MGYTNHRMKESLLLLATAALPIDYAMLIAAGSLAYALRFADIITDVRPILFRLSFSDYLPSLLIAGGVGVVLFALSGLYSLRYQLKLSQEIGRIFLGCTAGLALVIVLFFFDPELFSSRFIVLMGWALAFMFVSVGRLFFRFLKRTLRRRGVALSNVVLVGSGEVSDRVHELISLTPALGYRITLRIPTGEWKSELVLPEETDEVLVTDPMTDRSTNVMIYEYCATHHLGFQYVADTLTAQSHNIVTRTLAGLPMIEILRTPLEGWGRVLKRIFDLVMALFLLLVLFPVFLALTLTVLLDTGWPIFVGLTRVGEGGKSFTLYKFRSMVRNAHQLKADLQQFNERSDGPLFKMSQDPRVTRSGRHLRRLSLDELPQLWNVLRGEMSLVGPRPHEPEEVARYALGQHRLLNLKPGMTGLAQVSGRSELSFSEEARLDTFYVENWSLGQDLVILVKTVVVVLQRKAVA